MKQKKKTAQVYVAGSLRHVPMSWWEMYERIGKVVEEVGMKAFVPHIENPKKFGFNPKEIHNPKMEDSYSVKIFERDISVIENSDMIIAEVTNPSLGTGIEIGWALNKNKKVICLVKRGTLLTSLIRGPSSKGLLKLIEYDKEEEALNKLREMLKVMSI